MKFIHTADWQLGMTRHFLDADAQARFTDARLDAISRIGELARRERAEFVAVCGDVFEDNRISPAVIARSLDRVAAIGCAVYLLPGNHDPLDAASVYNSAAFRRHRPANVTVLREPGLYPVRLGVELLAAPWTSKHPARDPLTEVLADAADCAPGTVRIAVGHGGALAVGDLDAVLIDVAAVRGALDAGTVHYVALGDRHSVTEVLPRMWYSGAPEVTNFDHKERDSGSVLVVEVEPESVRVRPERVGSWRFLARTIALDTDAGPGGADPGGAVLGELAALPDKDRTVVKVGLTGTIGMAEKAGLDDEWEALQSRFASLGTWDRKTDLAVLPADGEFDALELGGSVRGAADELIGIAASGGERAADASGALALLYRLAGGVATGAAG